MNKDVQLRQLPYPYRAMLAICSDLDETPNRSVYWEENGSVSINAQAEKRLRVHKGLYREE